MITVIVNPAGEVQIDAIGFKGADCEKATAFLEQALGITLTRKRKADYYQAAVKKTQKVAT
jgi:hypothetical protein